MPDTWHRLHQFLSKCLEDEPQKSDGERIAYIRGALDMMEFFIDMMEEERQAAEQRRRIMYNRCKHKIDKEENNNAEG